MASKTDQSTAKMMNNTTKSTLLKHGLMPTYQQIQLSTEHLENYHIKLQQQLPSNEYNNDRLSTTEPTTEIPQLKLDEETTSQIIILHSYFSNFCTPSPTIGSIVHVYLLELHRIALLHDENSSSGGGKAAVIKAAGNIRDINCEELPKENIIQTQSTSYPYIIKLLSSNTNKVLLKLPLVFQLSFFRILIRLLSGVTNDEYDLECLFDFDGLSSTADDKAENVDESREKKGVHITGLLDSKCRLSNEGDEQSSSDDDSYNFIRKSSLGSTNSKRARDRTASSSSFFDTSTKSKTHNRSKSNISGNISGSNINSSVNRARTTSSEITIHKPNNNSRAEGSGSGNGKAYTAWSFGRWKKKKNAPLYSIVRFISNSKWNDDQQEDDTSIRRRRSWNWIGDNVRLNSEEERVFNEEHDNGDGGEESSDNEEEILRRNKYEKEDVVGILIRIYHAILHKCLKQEQSSCSKEEIGGTESGQYLLLGPVSHLIGLVCSTKVSVKNLRLLLVLIDGSDSSSFSSQQQQKNSPILNLAKLHILRALRYAAEYSIQINGMLIDKPGPQTFFSFGQQQQQHNDSKSSTTTKSKGSKCGLSSSFSMPYWPFKYDFGIACWFRAESFTAFDNMATKAAISNNLDYDDEQHVILFSARCKNGAQIEISFKPHSVETLTSTTAGGGNSGSTLVSTAATLFVTVKDATTVTNKSLRKVRLVGCVLSTGVWYHVAVRLSRPRLSRFSLAPFSSKDEVSIFLNGKLMLKEYMKMPQFPSDGSNGGSGKSGLFGSSIGSSSTESTKKVPLEISFFSNFDGQAGALYLFKDHVSEETINALYKETISSSDQSSSFSHFGSFVDRWDTNHGKLNSLTKAVSSASMHSELQDVILPNYSMFTGEYTEKRQILYDLVDDDDIDSDYIPTALSRQAFGSKLLIVWDPCRVSNGILIDSHLGAHVSMKGRASVWSFESVRDTIESVGGMSRILPLFERMLNQDTEGDMISSLARGGVTADHPNMIIPGLIFLVASFIREHESNACELYRCGGINIIEKLLHDNKKRDIEAGSVYRLGVSSTIAQYNASALLDLWQASRLNFALETTIFSRLVFNVPLLLGGLVESRGTSFHHLYLPILSEIAMMNGDKVRDCFGTGQLFDLVAEYSSSSDSNEVQQDIDEDEDLLFLEATTLSKSTLSSPEQGFVVDTLFGMITIMLSKRCPTSDLYPLLTFITYNLDLEWEANSSDMKNNSMDDDSATHSNRYRSTVKAVSILFFLLQKPNTPNLMDSLADIFDNGNGVASWMLCCLVNSFDDTIRGLGIKCLAAFLRIATKSNANANVDVSNSDKLRSVPSSQKIQKTMKLGLEAISHQANNMLSNVRSGKVNIKIIYKLLWHLLKCHRERLGCNSYAALIYLIINDGSLPSSTIPISDIIVPNSEMMGGFRLILDELDIQSSKVDPRQSIRNKSGVSTVLRLIRFLPNEQKERWLFDILAFLLASSLSVSIILSCDDWQPVLFQLVAEVLEEIYGEDTKDEEGSDSEKGIQRSQSGQSMVNTESLSKPSVRTRYDLSLKLYATLLGHCVRQGDDAAFNAVEMAASLQRVDANGQEIFSILLSHLFADLIEKGTVASVERTYSNSESRTAGRNRALKQSAKLVTQSILSNGAAGLNMKEAVKQWRCLRHLTALTVAVVTESGFGVVQLFDYRNQDASAVDGITGGMYGIRLDNLVSGVNSFEALAGAKLHANRPRDRYRYVSVVLASEMLTILDAFIFPDNLDASQAASQQHGLSLVRTTEPRLGISQGTLLASLVRLSLILLAYLEPSSVKFLQACSRLRCFLHWVLEVLRESVALGGYSEAFTELTAPLDRMILAVVLQCHRALSRCSVVLAEMESSPWQKYFSDIESRQKSIRRLFRAILELREIVLAAYRGRHEVLRIALSPLGYEALANSLDNDIPSPKSSEPSKEASLRGFLDNTWVSGFNDVDVDGDAIIPEMVANGQVHENREALKRGRQAMEELASESNAIIKEYSNLLNTPFTKYCETQRKWAETDAVRDREYEGDVLVKKLSSKYQTDIVDLNKSMTSSFLLTMKRLHMIIQITNDPWNQPRHWKFNAYTDLLYRRILFQPNYSFDNHASASYELSLGKEREMYEQEEAERKKRLEEAKKERERAEELLRAAIVPYTEPVEDDAEDEEDDDDDDRADSDGFLGWNLSEDRNESFEHSSSGKVDGAENEEQTDDPQNTSTDNQSSVKDIDESWDQIEAADYEEGDESDPFAWARKFMWAEGERYVHSFESIVMVSIQNTKAGTLLLTSHSIYFRQLGETMDVMTKEAVKSGDEKGRKQDMKWKLSRLTDVHGRRYMLKAQALELFFANMEGVFFTFNGTKDRDLFHAKLRGSCKAPLLRSFKSLNPRSVFKKSKLTDLWQKRKISNFQYIMALNLMAGRTFNDITQYPVFPWILADYTSKTLDLSDSSVYRDLSKPVGALNPDRLEQLLDRYDDLDGFPEEEKFLYGSHYSSPGVVLHYLIRQEPYTSMHVTLQSDRFDCPDRLFFDLSGCWKSCNTSTSDVKELIPEFFLCPDIFTNTNEFPLGKTQAKVCVDSVKLPPWAKGSPHEFIRLHKLALESDYVSDNLHHWVDLIFGYKQRGPAALDAHNVFHYLSYEGAVDIDKITDEVERKAIEGHISNFGQTPSQLMPKEPHPPRSFVEDEPLPLFQDLRLEQMRCDTPKKQFGGPKNSSVSGPIISIHALGEYIFAIHSDFTICTYKLTHSRGSSPFHFKTDRARELESKDMSFCHARAKGYDEENHQQDVSFAIALGSNKSQVTGSSDPYHLLISSGYFDNCVKTHSLDSLQLLNSLNGEHRGRIRCLEVDDEGEILVTGGEDATCRVWIVDHDSLAYAITDGFVKTSLGSSNDTFEGSDSSHVHTLLGHVTPVTCVAICTKLDIVISGSQGGTICIHNIRSGKFIRSLHIDCNTKEVQESCSGYGIPVTKLAIHIDGYFVAHLCDGSLYVITINGQQLLRTDIDEHLTSMLVCPKSDSVITGGSMGCVRIWKLSDLSLQCTVDVKKHGSITSLAFAHDSEFLCIGSSSGLLSIVSRIPE